MHHLRQDIENGSTGEATPGFTPCATRLPRHRARRFPTFLIVNTRAPKCSRKSGGVDWRNAYSKTFRTIDSSRGLARSRDAQESGSLKSPLRRHNAVQPGIHQRRIGISEPPDPHIGPPGIGVLETSKRDATGLP
jgi:hypothetical protein